MRKELFKKGLAHAIPIALAYFSVSFGFGIMAEKSGLTVWQAALLSITNLTSSGQVAGVGVIAAGGTYLETAMTQLVINLRYALMGLSLTQKLEDGYTLPQRLITAYVLTDEVFVLASAQDKVRPWYVYGMLAAAVVSWTSGTALGAAAGEILPTALSDAMGIILYGMFLALFIPAAKKERSVLVVVCVAAACSVLFRYVFTAVSGGFALIIATVAAATVGAALFPIPAEEEGEAV